MPAASPKMPANRLIKLAPRIGKSLAADIAQALSEPTIVVPGTHAAPRVRPRLTPGRAAQATRRNGCRGRAPGAKQPSLAGPEQHARRRAQLRSTTPDQGGAHGLCLGRPLSGASGHRCRPGAGDPALRLLDSRRAPLGVSTRYSNAPCFSRPLPLCETRSPRLTTAETSSRASATTGHSSRRLAGAETLFLPCCAKALFINRKRPPVLDELHRGSPDPRLAPGHTPDPAVRRTFYKGVPIVSDSPIWIDDAI